MNRPTLADGELYAGVLLGKDGEADQHVVLLQGDAGNIDWDEALDWAASIGGSLPTRREQALLLANLPEEFKPRWYWSGEQSSLLSAWRQNFDDEGQDHYRKNSPGRARAVRRIPVSEVQP